MEDALFVVIVNFTQLFDEKDGYDHKSRFKIPIKLKTFYFSTLNVSKKAMEEIAKCDYCIVIVELQSCLSSTWYKTTYVDQRKVAKVLTVCKYYAEHNSHGCFANVILCVPGKRENGVMELLNFIINGLDKQESVVMHSGVELVNAKTASWILRPWTKNSQDNESNDNVIEYMLIGFAEREVTLNHFDTNGKRI